MNVITHEPVMIEEAIRLLNIRKNFLYIDATFGMGGFTKKILESNDCNVISIDRDPDVKKYSSELKKVYKNRFKFILGKFGSLNSILESENLNKINGGIVADLGMSNLQIEDGKRGFSIKNNGPLDMRMSKIGISADQIVNTFKEDQLSEIFWVYGQEHKSKKLASKIVYARKKNRINTTHDLVNLVLQVKPHKKPYRIHPATKIFQALRIFINNELEEIKNLINNSIKLLIPGARLVLITFHSLEDRIVKNSFNKLCGFNNSVNRHLPIKEKVNSPKFKKVGKSFITPSINEIKKNNKSRSAKLRVIERVSL